MENQVVTVAEAFRGQKMSPGLSNVLKTFGDMPLARELSADDTKYLAQLIAGNPDTAVATLENLVVKR